ncbi:CPBP family intramembrane metalloprotease [Phycicoccus sp. HDW14]|uniref:CPBP family intramembrane glutamic endopeptidase n=1 Tax=Phycicoccus sp. HDW14 TaxID=2714941 RepID=UPI00140896DF|nr:CPBP family intramembrane glutamic endopeptidase [Phycicoccus sp. HDW14]QIM19951.1 CPBP family intramembrane metalloprotease [Phycicoccus sp. HDW14]
MRSTPQTTPDRAEHGTPSTAAATTTIEDAVVARTAGNRHLAIAIAAMFLMPWVVWGSAIAQAHDLIGWRLPQGVALWVLTPSIVVGVLLIGGRPALADLTRRVLRWRGPLWVYAAAVAVPVVIGATTLGLTVAAGRPVHLGQSEGLAGCALYFCYAIGLFLLTEEAGWTGVLMPRLQVRLRPLAASLVLGVIWGLWHLPLLNVPGERDHGLPFLAFVLLIVPTRVLMSAVVNAGRGAVLVAALFHAAFNATCLYVGVVGSDRALIWTAGAVTTGLAVLAAVATRGRLLHDVAA